MKVDGGIIHFENWRYGKGRGLAQNKDYDILLFYKYTKNIFLKRF